MRAPSGTWSGPRGWAALAVVVVAGLITPAPVAAQQPEPTTPTPPPSAVPPGEYVTEAPVNGAFPVPESGVTLAVGSGTSTSSTSGPLEIVSVAQFASSVQHPSTLLANGVQAFFDLGGEVMYVQLTRDESAASLAAGLDAVSMPLGSFDLIAVPGIGQLDVAGHQAVAVAADRLATRAGTALLLDTPDQISSTQDPTVVVQWAAALHAALPAADSAMIVSAALLGEEQQLVPASLAVAGLTAANAVERGLGDGVGGISQPLADYSPVWSVSNVELSVLLAGGVNSFRQVSGYGTVLWGNLMLSATDPDPARHAYLSGRLVTAQIETMMHLVGQSAVFLDNDPPTWAYVSRTLSTYLTDLWAAGMLFGAAPNDSFRVSVGLDTTMTAQDILNGYMVVNVDAAVYRVAEFVPLTMTQEMAS